MSDRGNRRDNRMVGRHPETRRVQALAGRAAASDLPVLITGETGTGKEMLARRVHDLSPRSRGPFVVVDCGAVCQELARSELFGHLKGAFTGACESRCGLVAAARGGTLFLDEVGELGESLQRQLLRLIQEGEYRAVGDSRVKRADVRVVAATHRDLGRLVKAGRFREDLFYRLRVVHLHLPPLRERRSDIPLLIAHFMAQYEREGVEVRPLSAEARALLEGYDWPGNVRDLAHALAGALALAEGAYIQAEDLPPEVQNVELEPEDAVYGLPYKEARRTCLNRFTREYLHRALVRAGGNVSKAARSSGIGRQYFQVRMAEHGLRAGQYRRRKNGQQT